MSPARNKIAVALIIVCVVALVAILLAGKFGRHPGQMRAAGSSGTALIGGPFEMIDQNGARFTDADLKGHLTLIYFGFTFCPDICPTELQAIGAALDLAGIKDAASAGDVQALFISIDPERDTQDVMAAYMPNFHPVMRGLTGTQQQAAATAKAFRVYYKKAEDTPGSKNYLMDHSSIIYLMGRDGEFIKHFGLGTPPEDIAAKLRELR